MATKSKVPFELHGGVKLAASIAVADGTRATLGPTAALGLVQRADMVGGAASVRLSPSANPVWERAAPEKGWWDSVCWSSDGSRWAAGFERWEGNERRGGAVVGDAASGQVVCEVELPSGAPITINRQGKSGALVALSPDGETLAWRGTRGEQKLLTLVDVASRRVSSTPLAQGEHDLFAHAFSGDRSLYTLSSEIAELGGTARWSADGTSVERRWDWAAGCAVVAAARGVWSLGINGVVWRVGVEQSAAFVAVKERRLQRAKALRARATHKWDVAYLDTEIARIERDERTFCWGTNTPRARWGRAPESVEGARCYDTELLWECGAAAAVGDDAIVVSDGVSVLLLREREGLLQSEVLIDDTERCSPRVSRIVDVSVSGTTLAVLWKKSASASVLSLFAMEAALR